MVTANDLGACFVTGGAGFIGSHLVERLLAGGNTVTAYDNLSNGRGEWLGRLLDEPRFSLAERDLRDSESLKEAMAGHDVVFHLGSNTDVRRGNQDTRLDLENDVIATHNVLEAMRELGIRQLLFASSSTVLGEPEVRPTPEEVGPLLPISMYGAGKLACEGYISAYCHLFGVQAWIFRFGNVVGPRMRHGILCDFIAKLRRNPNELEILGDGNQEKNYFLVEDCIEGMLHAFRYACDRPCDVFNLGSETTLTATDIAGIVTDEVGLSDVTFRYTGGNGGWPGDVPRVIYDLTKMRRLGWQARHSSAAAVRIALRRMLGREQALTVAGE